MIIPILRYLIPVLPNPPRSFSDKIDKLSYIDGKSDWIDLRAAENVKLKKDEFYLIPLGVAMEFSDRCKASSKHIMGWCSIILNWQIRSLILISVSRSA